MNRAEVMQWLQSKGSDPVKRIYMNHGASEPLFGVKTGDLKELLKQTGKDHDLALELYRTGNGDAQYFAGLIADPYKFDKAELQYWAENAAWYMVSEYSVAWNAAESAYGTECGLEWIGSDTDKIISSGWCSLAYRCQLNIHTDPDLYRELVTRVRDTLHQSPDRTRYCMNGFLIACGSSVPGLTELCKETAAAIGTIQVNMGNTACKVPEAVSYINKAIARGSYTKKKKTVKC